ncbi:helix-turn-helix domain-containing protein [Flagellimonas sp.]|uniref:helix-turn-helix domain-containing protein n=1 Tax=Flagellimonas sp. TaxID=2058762 RepID=UPI003BAA3B92
MGIFIIYALVSPIVTHFLYFLIPELGPNYRLIFSVLDIIALFWIGLHGLVQKNVTSILNQYEPIFDPLSENAIASTLEEDPEQMGKLMEQIDNYMYSSEPFCHSDLTITDLAQELKMHPKKISTVINTVNHENFNCYVNNFRVKKAERILNSDKFKNLSIEGIAKEAGFHSRSAFYRAFRKFTGTTPTKYRQQLI